MSNDEFQGAVRRELEFLVDHYGFRLVEESARWIRYASASVEVAAAFDPRGEIELRICRLNDSDPHATLTLSGIVGRTDAAGVVELLAAQIREHDPALRGNREFFDRLAAVQRKWSEAWTAYYSGRGPRPETGALP